MLDNVTVEAVKFVARDKMLQAEVISSLLAGCERGTDLWEDLECARAKFSKDTQLILWGERVTDDEDEECECDPASLYAMADPHEVICAIIDEVESNVRKSILKEP